MNLPASILLFGIARDLTGQSVLTVPLPAGARVSDLLQLVSQQYPDLGRIRAMMVAVNGAYAEADQVLNQTDEIALIPPVSGG
jgi:molybdopterin converting factor subunit 1